MRPGQSRRRLRVTTGCLTCRARRVKCDERRPVCRNCGKKGRSCRYHAIEYDTALSSNGRVADITNRPAQTASLEGRSDHIDTTRPLADTESRTLDVSSGVLENHHHAPLSVAEQTEPIYTDITTPSVPALVDHDSSLQTHPPEPSPAPNLCAILRHTNFPTPSHRPSHVNSPAHAPPYQPFEESLHHDHSIQRTFHVQAPIQLSPTEVLVFRNYVERVSKWIDSFSHDQPFYNKVPSLALHCPMLMHSCLAASAKQLSRAPQSTSPVPLTTSPVYYYQQALREMSHFLIDPGYSSSDELLASSIILSTYEILDVSGPSFGSHLHGVASLIRSHGITGAETGIRGATYWTWYRHEVWVAFQSGRGMFLNERYWRPSDSKGVDGFEGLSIRDVANRVLFVFGQCVSFYVRAGKREGEEEDEEGGGRGRQQSRARELRDALQDWESKLPASMRICFRQSTQSTHSEKSQRQGSPAAEQFPALWFAYPESAISHQLHHASRILLYLRTPSLSTTTTTNTTTDPFRTRRELERSRREIFMTANARIDQTWGLISTQCLYVAGLVTEGVLEREGTLELIELCQRTTGRRTVCIADQLRGFWGED